MLEEAELKERRSRSNNQFFDYVLNSTKIRSTFEAADVVDVHKIGLVTTYY